MTTRACRRCGDPIVARTSATPDDKPHCARQMCSGCYSDAKRTGEIINYPRTTKSRADVLEDWGICRRRNMGKREAAQIMGMTYGALDQALRRARLAGEQVAA